MAEQIVREDASHYEVSLTATQAVVAFVLLLFSLAAAFAFGVIVGRGRGDDRLVVRRQEPAVITEGNAPGRKDSSRIVELGVEAAQTTDMTATATGTDGALVQEIDAAPIATATDTAAPVPAPAEEGSAWYAQLLSSGDAKAAEGLAARLIEAGYTTAYVERVPTPQGGMIYRVRVRFPTEAAARSAAGALRPYAAGDVWITKQ